MLEVSKMHHQQISLSCNTWMPGSCMETWGWWTPLCIAYTGHMKRIPTKETDWLYKLITGLCYKVQKAAHDHSQLWTQHCVKAPAMLHYITKGRLKKSLSKQPPPPKNVKSLRVWFAFINIGCSLPSRKQRVNTGQRYPGFLTASQLLLFKRRRHQLCLGSRWISQRVLCYL